MIRLLIMKQEYINWKNNIKDDSLLLNDNKLIKNDNDINDRFFTELEFGTGGLRGQLGLGPNRMNKYVVRRATQGLCDYLLSKSINPSVAIAYDSRNYSKEFAIEAANTFASNNIKVHIMKELAPTPLLSFMVRYLKCDAGIVITASHNPKEYNGYKVYGKDGGQITLEVASEVLSNIKKHNYFEPINDNYDDFVNKGLINIHDSDISDAFIKSTLKESLYDSDKKDIKILYTPLNGAGNKYVTRLFDIKGYTYKVVEEQRDPDGNFTTCPKPNPELREAMQLGINRLKELNYDVLFATDPDADRCGVVVNDKTNIKLFTGDEVGLLLFDFVYHIKKENNILPNNPVVIKTIATTDLIHKMAKEYNVRVIDTLTGFKYIGEQLELLVNKGKGNDFLIGIEDSCGYLTNKDVRDKDSINAALLIAEMANYYKNKGITLLNRLNEIYKEFGKFESCLKFIELYGEEGKKQISKMMRTYRNDNFYKNFLDCVGKYDYLLQQGYGSELGKKYDLPKSNVIKFYFKDGCAVLARPSGTEPKIKFYYLTNSNTKEKDIMIKLANIETI